MKRKYYRGTYDFIEIGVLEIMKLLNFHTELMNIKVIGIKHLNYVVNPGQTVHGGLTSWGNWSTCDCDHSTGTGTRNRTRSCTNPAPSCYGR